MRQDLVAIQEGNAVFCWPGVTKASKQAFQNTLPFFQEMVGRLGSEDAAYRELGSAPGSSRFASPEEIASAVCYLASDAAAMITGTDLVIDDGYTI